MKVALFRFGAIAFGQTAAGPTVEKSAKNVE